MKNLKMNFISLAMRNEESALNTMLDPGRFKRRYTPATTPQ